MVQSITPIRPHFGDEHVVGVDPPIRPNTGTFWRRRIRPFTGRALSHVALEAERQTLSGLQRLRGQSVSHGTIAGLEVSLSRDAIGAPLDAARIRVGEGLGLARSGEDVSIPATRSLALAKLPTIARVDLGEDERDGSASDRTRAAMGNGPNLRPEAPRTMYRSLEHLIAQGHGDALPRVMVLVAEPVVMVELANPSDGDCPPDRRDEAFDDLQYVDGARLALYAWPEEMTGIGGSLGYAMPGPGAQRRNLLAHRIFDVERSFASGDAHPWENHGVPLAMIGFAEDWSLEFIDAAAVARIGGHPLPRSYSAGRGGNPYLWQARMAQFAGQVLELENADANAFARPFALLPPVGMLPGDLFDPLTRHQSFFPSGFDVRMAPVAIEQVELAMREAAPLAPLDMTQPDSVELLLPVPAKLYDGDLFRLAAPEPAFQIAIDRFVDDRSDWLKRRGSVRSSMNALNLAYNGKYAEFPAEDDRSGELGAVGDLPAPLGAARILRIEAGNGVEVVGAGPSIPLPLGEGGRLSLWVRLSSSKPPKALAVRIAASEDGKSGVLGHVWGERKALAEMDDLPKEVGESDLPEVDSWIRLSIDGADVAAKAAGQVAHLVLVQAGGVAEWGPIAASDAAGRERALFAGYWPEKSRLEASAKAKASEPLELGEDGFGVVVSGDFLTVPDIAAFSARWQQDFLADHLKLLANKGLIGLAEDVDKRLKSTNDAIDLGFVRARSDIYRLREYILGKDAASKLVTSPALADLSSRDESARATGEDLARFLEKSHTTLVSDTGFGRFAKATEKVAVEVAPARAAAATERGPSPVPTPAPSEKSVTMASMKAFKPARIAGVTSSMVTLAAPPPPPAPPPSPMLNVALGLTPQPGMIGLLGAQAISPAEPSRVPALEWATPVRPVAVAATEPAVPTYRVATDIKYDLRPTYASVAAGIFARDITKRDIQLDRPLPSLVERTVSVARRIDDPPSKKAYEYAVAGKMAIMNTIAGLVGDIEQRDRARGIALADLPAPGFIFTGDEAKAKKDGRTPNTIGDVLLDQQRTGGEPGKTEYSDPADLSADESSRHESEYFNAAVKALDNAIALMRFVEGRIDLYTGFLADARQTAEAIAARIDAASARLHAIGIELEEARHDVEVGLSLLAEAEKDAAETNARRAGIIREFGHTMIFRRARRDLLRRPLRTATTQDALAPDPVFTCMRGHEDQPEELRAYVGLFQDAPLAWFPSIARQVDALDKRPVAVNFLAAVSARLALARPIQPIVQASTARALLAVQGAMVMQGARLGKRYDLVQRLDFARLTRLDLGEMQRKVQELASLGDVMDAARERPQLARAASAMMEDLGKVAACLHAGFDDVAPVIRMQWAELLSQHDEPIALARLSALPQWGAIPIEQRRALQDLVNWLFAQIDTAKEDAVEAMSELVRVALLLAAHAPVDQLIPATLVASVPAEPGQRVPLAIDVSVIRTGLIGVIRNAQGVSVAQARIEEIGPDIAQARIVRSFVPGVSLQKGFKVDFGSRKLR